jgi:hypothetical protein
MHSDEQDMINVCNRAALLPPKKPDGTDAMTVRYQEWRANELRTSSMQARMLFAIGATHV